MDHSDDLPLLLSINVDRHTPRLVETYTRKLYAFVYGYVHHQQDAEDIVGNVWKSVYVALKNYPAEKVRTLLIEPWLIKIATNEIRDHIQKKLLTQRESLPLPENIYDVEDTTAELPEMALVRMENRSELMRFLGILPENYRVVLTLYYFGGFSQSEIAIILHLPLSTVKTRMYRGKERLREVLTTHASTGR